MRMREASEVVPKPMIPIGSRPILWHVVAIDDRGVVDGISDVTRSDVWINGGYFVMRSELLDHLGPGEDLVEEPFSRLMETNQLMAQRHHGFWAPMDTLKDKQSLE